MRSVCVCACTCDPVADAVVVRLEDLFMFVRAVHDPCRGALNNTVGIVLRFDLHLTVTMHMHAHTHTQYRVITSDYLPFQDILSSDGM